MYDAPIDSTEEEKPEVTVDVKVFFHADTQDQVEVRERLEQIRAIIEEALADDDNAVRGFVYPEVRLAVPQSAGRTVTA